MEDFFWIRATDLMLENRKEIIKAAKYGTRIKINFIKEKSKHPITRLYFRGNTWQIATVVYYVAQKIKELEIKQNSNDKQR